MDTSLQLLVSSIRDSEHRIREDIHGVHERLDVLNGRVRKTENRLVEHGVRLGTVETRFGASIKKLDTVITIKHLIGFVAFLASLGTMWTVWEKLL